MEKPTLSDYIKLSSIGWGIMLVGIVVSLLLGIDRYEYNWGIAIPRIISSVILGLHFVFLGELIVIANKIYTRMKANNNSIMLSNEELPPL